MGIATGFPCKAAFLAVRYQNIVRMIPVLEPLLLNGRVNAFYAPFDFKWGISLRTAGEGCRQKTLFERFRDGKCRVFMCLPCIVLQSRAAFGMGCCGFGCFGAGFDGI